MLKSAVARLFLELLLFFRSIFRPPLQLLSVIYRHIISLLLMAIILPLVSSSSVIQSEPRSFDTAPCQTNIPGDCNPQSCHGTCEGRYARFWDGRLKIDRTMKSCQCMQEPICSLVGMNAYTGCRTYNMLSATAQQTIRLWTMSDVEKSNYGRSTLFAPGSERSWDQLRHQQLLNANSRFCCWTVKLTSATNANFQCFKFCPLFFFLFCFFFL